MSKGTIDPFIRALSTPLFERSNRVNAVSPGRVWTSLNRTPNPAEAVANFAAVTPMGGPVQPEQTAAASVFLAAPAGSNSIREEIFPTVGG